MHLQIAFVQIQRSLVALSVVRGIAVDLYSYPACLHLHQASEHLQCNLSATNVWLQCSVY